MNIGFWMCIVLVPVFLIIGILFAVFKEKSVRFISGFNFLSKEEQAKYDRAHIARDMRNSCFIWAAVMLAGAVLCFLLTPYMAIGAYLVWSILVFREIHFDVYKAYEKYLLK